MAEDLEARLQRLEARIQRQEDIEAVTRLAHAYAHYLKRWDAAKVIDLFADDPESTVIIGDSGPFKGKAAITAHFAHFDNPPAEFLHMTMPSAAIVTVDPDGLHAKGRFFAFGVVSMPGEGGAQAFWSAGEFEDEFIKENGVWKIWKLHYNRTFFTPYEEGWVKEPEFVPACVEKKKPDPSIVYEPYPSTYVFPYHFKHPVTGE